MTSSKNYYNSTFNNYNCNFGDNSSYSTTSSSNPSPINDNQSIPVARESSCDRNSNITPTFDNVPLPVAHVSKIGTTSRRSAK